LNAEDTYFRVVIFLLTSWVHRPLLQLHLEDITEEEIGFTKECSSMENRTVVE